MMQVNDADLVTATLAGNREAFGQIVARYQTLICSLAYSSTGNVSQSEDVAQDTFIAAWKQLNNLREPAKLRSWLCGIARNLTWDVLKKEGREPSHDAESLEDIYESTAAPEPIPHDLAINNEEQAILWRSLQRVPAVYREPLVLFYREHQSVEAVASYLDLSEDAVKQRLSRGRKLLHDQVLLFVEGALERTNPGKAFTVAVLAALPASMTISAKAATLGAAAAKGSVAAKSAGLLGLLGALLSPLMGFFGMWVGYRMNMETARSDRERQFNSRFYKRLMYCVGAFFIACLALFFCGGGLIETHTGLFVGLALGIALAYVLSMGFYSAWCYRERRKLLANMTPEEIGTKPQTAVWEYRSRFQLLGMPLIHFRLGDRLGEPVRAWIAAGDCAFGGLIAFGGLAIAPISVGGCAIGLFSFGGLAIGAAVMGGLGLGGWAFGGLVFGWQAFGGCAIAWDSAWGGYAIAHGTAVGGVSHGAVTGGHAVIDALSKNHLFFRISAAIYPFLFWLNMIWVTPLIIQWAVLKSKMKQAKAQKILV